MLSCSAASADENDVLNFRASHSRLNDDNLFRLSDSVPPAASFAGASREETIETNTVGAKFKKTFGRQELTADVSISDVQFQNNRFLDYTAHNYNLDWQWKVGQRWSGEFVADRQQALNSFRDYQSLTTLQRNLRTIKNERFNADYWFHSNWHAVGGVSRISVLNELPILAESDYEATGANIGIRYKPASGNTLTYRLKTDDGRYVNRSFDVVSQSDDGFTQTGNELELIWQLTGKSQLRSRLEYISKKHNHFSSRDFSGWTGSADYIFNTSAKTLIGIGYRRDIVTFQQLTSSFYTSDAIAAIGKWMLSEKVSANVKAGIAERQYDGAVAPLPPGFVQREERLSNLAFEISYTPVRNLQLLAGISREKRDANTELYTYTARGTYFTLTFRF